MLSRLVATGYQFPAFLWAGLLGAWVSWGAEVTLVEPRLERLEDPKTGALDKKVHAELLAEGPKLLPALRARLKQGNCSAYAAALLMEIAPEEGLGILLDGLQEGRWRPPTRSAWGIAHIVGRCATGTGVKVTDDGGLLFYGSTGSLVTTQSMPLHLDGHEGLRESVGTMLVLFRCVVGGEPRFGRCQICGRDIRCTWFALEYDATARLELPKETDRGGSLLVYQLKVAHSCPAHHSSSTEICISAGGGIEAACAPRKWVGKMDPAAYLMVGRSLATRSRLSVAARPEPGGVEAAVGLLRNGDPVVRMNAARALGYWRAKEAVAPLVGALKGEDPLVRDAAIEALGDIGDRDATPALMEVLRGDDEKLRLRAIPALGKLKDARAVEALLPFLASQYPVSERAMYALAAIGAPAVPALTAALSQKDAGARRLTCRALAEIGERLAVPALIPLLRDPEPSIRYAAAEALRRLKDRRALKPLVDSLGDPTDWVRGRFTEVIKAIAQEDALGVFIEAMSHKDEAVRNEATRQVWLMGVGRRGPP